jgi:hypothetical protein
VRRLRWIGVVIKPESLGSWPSFAASGSWHDALFRRDLPKPLTIFAGQSDPMDDSHFTMRFHLPQGEGKIDGWLLNNDQLSITAKMPNGQSSAP